MPSFTKILKNEYLNEYQNEYTNMSENYLFTKPKIYDANGDINKRWYVYFSYRNPATGKMERQAPVYLDINRIKSVKERIIAIKRLRNILEDMLKNGQIPTKYQTDAYQEETDIDIQKAIQLSLKNAESSMKESSFKDYRQRLLKFERWLNERQFYGKSITEITRKTILNYLNDVLHKTSPKNRNNTRANLSIFFSFLEQNDYIKENFIRLIPVMDAKPIRNKTYTKEQEDLIFNTLEQKDKLMLLFIKFVSYNFLRPVEVCRLRIKDIDFTNAQLIVNAKNQSGKTKIIPKILMKEIDELKKHNPDHYLFTPKGVGISEVSEMQRRNYWAKRFKKIKDLLELDKDYTIYSFRHTFITKLYRELRLQYPPYETKSRLMLITGHSTMTALEKYLRDIDAELPDDYSHLLETNEPPPM